MKLKLQILLLLCVEYCLAQNNSIVIKDNENIVLNGSIQLVIDNDGNDAIARTGTQTGGFISNSEQSRICWNANTNSGITYTIPYKTSGGDQIPVSLTKNTAGTPTTEGRIVVSTYHTGGENTPLPANSSSYFSNVTNINNTEGSNNSSNMIDRYWLVCFENYTEKPTLTASFSFGVDGTNESDGITESDLQPQYWDGTAWRIASGTVGSHSITGIAGINFSAPWSLADKDSPLPIELLYFDAKCTNGKVELKWLTTSETNNDYFTVEKSRDAKNWNTVVNFKGAGNSNTYLYYSAEDNEPLTGNSYYRLKQTDFDGSYSYSKIVAISCNNTENNIKLISIQPNPASSDVDIILVSPADEEVNLVVYNNNGKVVAKKMFDITAGQSFNNMDIQKLKKGNYLFYVTTKDGVEIDSRHIIKKN